MGEVRTCRSCRVEYPVETFQMRRDGHRFYVCPECRERAQERARERHRSRNRTRSEQERAGTTVGAPSTAGKRCTRCGQLKPWVAFLPGFDYCRECQRLRREAGA